MSKYLQQDTISMVFVVGEKFLQLVVPCQKAA